MAMLQPTLDGGFKYAGVTPGMNEQEWRECLVFEAAYRKASKHLFHAYAKLAAVDTPERKWIQDEFQSAVCCAIETAAECAAALPHMIAAPEDETDDAAERQLVEMVRLARRLHGFDEGWMADMIDPAIVGRHYKVTTRLLRWVGGYDAAGHEAN